MAQDPTKTVPDAPATTAPPTNPNDQVNPNLTGTDPASDPVAAPDQPTTPGPAAAPAPEPEPTAAERSADQIAGRRRQALFPNADTPEAQADAQTFRDNWVAQHNAAVTRFAASARDNGLHPVTGQTIRYPAGTNVPENHFEDLIRRFEDYLLGEEEAHADILWPGH